MAPRDFATRLSDLAKQLAAATPEAADRIAETLHLACRTDFGGNPALKLKPLTVAEIQRAVASALRDAGPRGQSLPRRSYEALTERVRRQLRDQLLADIRAGAKALPGTAAVWRRPEAGEADARSLTPGPLTSVAAEFAAAETVATCDVLPRLVPTTYSGSALDEWARRLAGDNFDREFRLRDNAQSSLWQAGRNLARIVVQVDGAGRLLRVLGLDPEPYRAIVAAAARGETDPLAIRNSS